MHGDMVVHSAAQYQMMTGRVIPGFPAMGSWVVYGLGSEAESLPAYVVMPAPDGAQEAGLPMYQHGFLPAVYQPTMLRPGSKPVLNLDLPKGVTLIRTAQDHRPDPLAERSQPARRRSRICRAHFGIRYRVQDANRSAGRSSTSARSLKRRSIFTAWATPLTDDYGRRCLLARRMVEKGVRFICVVSGGGAADTEWDAHADIEKNHIKMA